MTTLDAAHAAMMAAPEADAMRLQYYQVLSDAVLFLWLEREPQGDTLTPRIFTLEDGPVVLAFDTEERLAGASGVPVPYAALPGRVVAQALAGQTSVGQGVALGINLGVAETAFLVPPAALEWLAAMLGRGPAEAEARAEGFASPGDLPPALLAALQVKLSRLEGAASGAVLVAIAYAGGRRGHMLGVLDTQDAAQGAVAQAVSEALTFSGVEAGELDVAFFGSGDAVVAAMLRVGLRLDMTAVSVAADVPKPKGPPRLR